MVLMVLTGPLQYLPRCVLAGIVFTIAVGMVDVKGLRDIRRESPGEFYLAVVTAVAVAGVGVEQGILVAIALSLLRHVRHSYRPHTMVLAPNAAGQWVPKPATLGVQTEPGLIVYRFGADLYLCKHQPLRRRSARAREARSDAGPLVHRRGCCNYGHRLLGGTVHARSARRAGTPRGRSSVCPSESIPPVRHGQTPHHCGDRRETDFHHTPRSGRRGA